MALDNVNCSPCYTGRPDYNPDAGTSILKEGSATRSSATINGIFFRSNLSWYNYSDFQGVICNEIEVEMIQPSDYTFEIIVYFEGTEVERFSGQEEPPADPITGPCFGILLETADNADINADNNVYTADGGGNFGIASWRSQVNAESQYISMPERDTDVRDIGGIDPTCLVTDAKTSLTGGTSPTPIPAESYRTGPDRSFVFVTKENSIGEANKFLGVGNNMLQWNFDINAWISYVPDQDCRAAGANCT